MHALGPNPIDVTASPNGCQSLIVTWTHRAPTPSLTLNHYRVRYQPQGGSEQTVTTTSQGSYTLTGLAPATTYTVRVDAQTQLGYGFYCCVPTATTHNGEASSDVQRRHALFATPCLMFLVYNMHVRTCTCMAACYSTTSACIPLATDPNNSYEDMHSLIVMKMCHFPVINECILV